MGAVSLIKGGPDQEAAKRFIDWCLTAKAQEIGQTVGSYQFLTHPDAKPPKQADELKGTQLIKYNFLWSGKHRDEVVNKWEKEIAPEKVIAPASNPVPEDRKQNE